MMILNDLAAHISGDGDDGAFAKAMDAEDGKETPENTTAGLTDLELTPQQNEIQRVTEVLKTDARKMLFHIADTLTTAKEIFEDTKPSDTDKSKRYYGLPLP